MYGTKTTEWNREARRAAEVMASFRNPPASKDTEDLMVVFVEQRGLNLDKGNVFIGWTPVGSVTDLLLSVQFGNPNDIGCIAWYPAMISDVEMHQNKLKKFRCRNNDNNWYICPPQIDAYLQQLRENIYGKDADTFDEEDELIAQPSTQLSPVKPPAKSKSRIKRKPKRNPKRRQH